ncbi:MAG: hypothetical protein KGI10_01210 [Thaumarchaeota archaeon]|nr:hypothetical protein [Nitrososphaerota archaeon]
MAVEKTGKIQEIRETVSCAVEIMRQIRAPGVQESLGKIVDMSTVAKDIIEALKTPEMVKNIENLRLITQNINEASEKMQGTIKLMEEIGVIQEAKEFARSAKNMMDLIGNTGQDLREVNVAVKSVFKSVQVLVDDIRPTESRY